MGEFFYIRQDPLVKHLIPMGILGAAALVFGRVQIGEDLVPQMQWVFLLMLAATPALFFLPYVFGFVPLMRRYMAPFRRLVPYVSLLYLIIVTFGRFLFLGSAEAMSVLFLAKRIVRFPSPEVEATFVYAALVIAALAHLIFARGSVVRNARRLREDILAESAPK